MTTPDLRTAVAPALGHIVLRVRSVERSELFYRQVLGLHVRERRGDQMVFLTRGIQHHDIALFAAEDSAPHLAVDRLAWITLRSRSLTSPRSRPRITAARRAV